MIERQFGIEIDADWLTTSGTAGAKPSALGDKALFERGVRGELARILRSAAGQHLAAALRYHSKTILLVPYTGEDCNAQEWWWALAR